MGRPPKLSEQQKQEALLMKQNGKPYSEILGKFGISSTTLWRYEKEQKIAKLIGDMAVPIVDGGATNNVKG